MMFGPKLTHEQVITVKIGATQAYSEEYGLPLGTVARMFSDAGVYRYLEENADLFATRTFRYTAGSIERYFSLQA